MRSALVKWIRHPGFTLACRLIVGGIFLFASIHKLIDPQGFAQAVYNYKILPGAWINGAAIVMPWLEILAGLALILGIRTRGAALILSILLAVFAAALGISLVRGLDISCGCFSSGGESITGMYLLRDVGLLLAALQVLVFDQGRYRVFPIRKR